MSPAMTEPEDESSFRGFLVRMVLRRYASDLLPRPGPAWARIACVSESSAELFRTACDAWVIPLGDIARRASVEEVILPKFIMGMRPLSVAETKAVALALYAIVNKFDTRRNVG